MHASARDSCGLRSVIGSLGICCSRAGPGPLGWTRCMFTSLIQRLHALRAKAAPHDARLAAVAYVLVACTAVLPLWTARYPAIQDLPQHLAAVRVLFDYADPELRFSDYFERTPF